MASTVNFKARALMFYEDVRIFAGCRMGFKDAKKAVMEALATGNFQHEARHDINVKNMLMTGDVTPAQVSDIIKKSSGNDHNSTPHHRDASIQVHVIKKSGWYIKFYFIEPTTWFISVHEVSP